VLAAEEFAMPTRDDRYPRDPTGIQEPHDVLAAEEFAMPVGGDRDASAGFRARSLLLPVALLVVAAALALRLRA
jgi:hypothetical protein